MRDSEIDWSDCSDVERVPGRVSGRWVVKDSRILADGIIENFDAGASPEEIGEEICDGLGSDCARRIIEYAVAQRQAAKPAAVRAQAIRRNQL